jgi:hypothetical protein
MLLAFALIGWFAFFPLMIVAWIMANNDLNEIDSGRMDPAGRSMTYAAKILGMLGTILVIIGVVIWCIVAVFLFGLFGAVAANR